MNLGDSGPIFAKDEEVLNDREQSEIAGHDCLRARQLNELRDIGGGIGRRRSL
jgi:hypothetical protein